MIIAGLGFTSSATQEDLHHAICSTLRSCGLALSDLGLLASSKHKYDCAALRSVALELNVPLRGIDQAALASIPDDRMGYSKRCMKETGIASLSEAAALGAAGQRGRLLTARTIYGPVTCALATTAKEQKNTS